MAHSVKIGEALNDILSQCDGKQLSRLALYIQEFKQTSPRSYRGVRQQPFAANMLDAMEDAIGFVTATEDN